eukprot:6212750-Pleurochrysis_carterae.AAC.5
MALGAEQLPGSGALCALLTPRACLMRRLLTGRKLRSCDGGCCWRPQTSGGWCSTFREAAR